ncbi:hypothetical protein MEO40_17735 [Dolichospermum sp. ST_sed1]|nr:hypothetical protein [Dolichospermum sp. ST_sed1]
MELVDVIDFDNKILYKLFNNHIPKCKVVENHKNMNIKQIIINNPNDSIIVKSGFCVYLINFNYYYCKDHNLDIFDKIIWTGLDKPNIVTQIEFKNMRGV